MTELIIALIGASLLGFWWGRKKLKEKGKKIHHETLNRISEASAEAAGRDPSRAGERMRARFDTR